jgi:hypothetical protein
VTSNTGKKHLQRQTVPDSAASGKEDKVNYLNKDVAKLQGWRRQKDPSVFVSLRFVQHDHQCFSAWSREEMKAYWAFQEKVSNYTWIQLYQQGGKLPNKVGFAYTAIDVTKYPEGNFRKNLSADITLFELRVSEEIRVHGFRSDVVFYVCWLDKNHDIFD